MFVCIQKLQISPGKQLQSIWTQTVLLKVKMETFKNE